MGFTWMFDGMIFSFLILSGVFLIHSFHAWRTFRHKRLMTLLIGSVSVAWGVVFYGSFIEPNLLFTREYTVALPPSDATSPETIRIAVVADMHLGHHHGKEWTERIVEEEMEVRPDLILLAGDFIGGRSKEAELLEGLRELTAPYGVFAVTGNHDYTNRSERAVIEALQAAGVRVLENTSEVIEVQKKSLTLVGVSDIWFASDFEQAFEGVSEEGSTILLAHNPDAVLFPEATKADLVIAGHTHGGQIRLPFLGPVPPIPDKLGRAYDQGLFSYGNGQLFVTSGTGTTGPRARLFTPPVVDILTLTF